MLTYRAFLESTEDDLENIRSKIAGALADANYEAGAEDWREQVMDDNGNFDEDDAKEACRDAYDATPFDELLSAYLDFDDSLSVCGPEEKLLLYKKFPWAIEDVLDPTKDFTLQQQFTLVKHKPEFVKYIKTPFEPVQEYILRTRPDLVGKIQNLDPTLKAKYSHEVGLGGVDL